MIFFLGLSQASSLVLSSSFPAVLYTAPLFDGSDGRNLPAMQETWVPSLGGNDLLRKGMATQSSILAWRIP